MSVSRLKIATPYMMTIDGNLHECGEMHPYLKYVYEDSAKYQICYLFNHNYDALMWFYTHTYDTNRAADLSAFINTVVYYRNEFDLSDDTVRRCIRDFQITGVSNLSLNDLYYLYEGLNYYYNLRYCKVRMSALKWGGTDRSIYYRLTEVSPDWFKAIHKSVLKHNLDIDDVTICIDPQSTGSPIKYAHYGTKQITYVPTKELLLTCEGDFGKYAID